MICWSGSPPVEKTAHHETKTALITGANRGLGLEAARLFLENGYRVVFAGRSLGDLEEARRQLDPEGTRSSTLELNMATVCLAKQFAGTPLVINAISPGAAPKWAEKRPRAAPARVPR